jgi:hypothetical protein
MSARLHRYLDARRDGDLGWVARYEGEVCPGRGPDATVAWLAGHYQGLLDDLIAIVGDRAASALVAAHIEIRERIKAGPCE